MKNRVVAAVIAIIFGFIGAHRFYLRDFGGGAFYVFLLIFTLNLNISILSFPITAIFGILDGFKLLSMSDEKFDKKYNRKGNRRGRYVQREEERRSRRQEPRQALPARRQRENPFKKSGIRKYKEFDLEEAILDFQKGLEIEPKDIALHFNLACAYSLTEKKEEAFYHLDQAIKNGFKNTERILNHDDLAYIRIQPEFETFKANGFQLDKSSAAKIEMDNIQKDDVLLSQLNKLAELRKKGLLSEEEFSLEKKKLLSR